MEAILTFKHGGQGMKKEYRKPRIKTAWFKLTFHWLCVAYFDHRYGNGRLAKRMLESVGL